MDQAAPHNLPNIHPFSTVFPEKPGEICARGQSTDWRATWLDRSAIALAHDPAAVLGDHAPAIAWSGSFAEAGGGGLFEEDPRTWAAPGWAALEAACRKLHRAPGSLLLRPHFRHVISDIPSCRRLLDADWARELGMGLVYDPAAMCAPSMLGSGRVEDHLRRMYETIELFPNREVGGLKAVIVGTPSAEGLPTAPYTANPLSQFILDLAKAHIPPGLPTLVPA
jgi:hypothetical protein